MIMRKPPYNRDKQEGSSTQKDSQQKKHEEEDEKWGMGVRKDFSKKHFKWKNDNVSSFHMRFSSYYDTWAV